jgi:hypothetical protein
MSQTSVVSATHKCFQQHANVSSNISTNSIWEQATLDNMCQRLRSAPQSSPAISKQPNNSSMNQSNNSNTPDSKKGGDHRSGLQSHPADEYQRKHRTCGQGTEYPRELRSLGGWALTAVPQDGMKGTQPDTWGQPQRWRCRHSTPPCQKGPVAQCCEVLDAKAALTYCCEVLAVCVDASIVVTKVN